MKAVGSSLFSFLSKYALEIWELDGMWEQPGFRRLRFATLHPCHRDLGLGLSLLWTGHQYRPHLVAKSTGSLVPDSWIPLLALSLPLTALWPWASYLTSLGFGGFLDLWGDANTHTGDIVSYNKKYTFGLHPVSSTELLDPWNFPSGKSYRCLLLC